MEIRIFGKQLLSVSSGEKAETRSDTSSLKNPREWLVKLLGLDSVSGISVTPDNASTLGAFVGMLRILSETVAILPIGFYIKTGNTRQPLAEHSANRLLSVKPNPVMNTFTWFETMMVNAAAFGNAYSMIIRDQLGRPVELKFLGKYGDSFGSMVNVEPFIEKNRLWYYITGDPSINTPVAAEDMFHIKGWGYDGIKGKNFLSYAREIIGGGLAAQFLANSTYTSGGLKKLALTHPTSVDDTIQEKIKNDFLSQTGTIGKALKPVFLQMGLNVQELGFSPEDLQLLNSREFTVSDISRISRVPLHMLASAKQTSYNSNEQMAQEFISYTMMPWFRKIECEINDKLLREDEKGKVYCKFNVNALLRGNIVDRSNYYSKGIQWGWFSPNDVRALEDENPREGGDEYLTPVNMYTTEMLELQKLKQEKELKTE